MCKENAKLFNSENIELIFGNIEEVYEFQKHVLEELETVMNRKMMEDTQIGNIFVDNVSWVHLFMHTT